MPLHEWGLSCSAGDPVHAVPPNLVAARLAEPRAMQDAQHQPALRLPVAGGSTTAARCTSCAIGGEATRVLVAPHPTSNMHMTMAAIRITGRVGTA